MQLLGFFLTLGGLLQRSLHCDCRLAELRASVKETEHLQPPLRQHFKDPPFPVNFRVASVDDGKAISRELVEVNELMLENRDWLIGTVSRDRRPVVTNSYASFYNVFLANDYNPAVKLLQNLNYTDYEAAGRCLLVVNSVFDVQRLVQLMDIFWKLHILNVVVVVHDLSSPVRSTYRAYSYQPFREGKCEQLEPILLDRYADGRWTNLHRWYRNKLRHFHGCTVQVGTISAKPYSMAKPNTNATDRYGMEVSIVENVASWFNFTIRYRSPVDHVKWGIIRAENSTGLMGMIQRKEVGFAFGCLGYNEYRNRFLNLGIPSFITQLSIAIPPERPYTWLEKLFQPFTLEAWLCITLCYTAYMLVTVLIFDSNLVTTVEHFRNPAYNLWVMLMGGPPRTFRRSSIRLFITGFVLNTLVIRTMYQSAMFERLQATTTLGSGLNTFEQINEEGMPYYMYITTSFYYKDNPLLRGRIRILWDESRDWDEVMYNISQYTLKGVFAIPLDAIEYYMKYYGKRGLVYVSKRTGINYNPGFIYPKASPLSEPFNALIGRYQAAGLISIWREQFRDTRYWNNAKRHPEPISLHWSHLAGAFYLWACLLALSTLVLTTRDGTRELLSTVVRAHYKRGPNSFLAVRVQNGNSSKASPLQQDLIEGLTHTSSVRLSVSFGELPVTEGRPAYYNIFLVRDDHSLYSLLDGMSYQAYQFDGLYTIIIERLPRYDRLHALMRKLWSLRLLNVVVLVEKHNGEGTFLAYAYHPYREQKCGIIEPYEIDRYVNGSWTGGDPPAHWFPVRTHNFNGCPLDIGTIDISPCSIILRQGNRTTHQGIEVSQVESLSKRLNFTVRYRISDGNVRWGFALPTNSTGLMGWIQRGEVDFGFASIGISASRVQYLRTGTPSRYGQVLMAIPPKRPYTSLEKLFRPFGLQTWLCIVLCQVGISLLARTLFGSDRLRHAFYTLWVLTMGGPVTGRLRMDSTRIFIILFVLNVLVVRTLYHAALFERLQAADSLASDLNTLQQINDAGKMYHMHKTIGLFYYDNPLVGRSRIRLFPNDSANWQAILYQLSQPGSDFVVALPLDCIKYYVKLYGERGLVYVGKHTGFTYNTAFFYPRSTSLQEPFSALVLAFHSAGLVDHWARAFEDTRYWSNARSEREPASIKWDHICGAFYLCGTMHLLAVVVFGVELGWARWRSPAEELPLDARSDANGRHLTAVLREHYRKVGPEVHLRVWNGNESRGLTSQQADLLADVTRSNADWMIVSFGALPKHRPAYCNLMLVLDYDAFCHGLQQLDHESYQFDGLYTFAFEQHAAQNRELLAVVTRQLWNIRILNAVVIVEEEDDWGTYVAYSYHPYQAGRCDIAEPYELDRFVNGSWNRLQRWFPDRLANLHGCSQTVGQVECKPFSMVHTVGNRTVHYGLEVHIVEMLATRLNFTIRYVQPRDNVKWGTLSERNSSGLVGMIQRHEADFGFGSLGFSLNRHTYLRMGVPNHLSQMIMAIPPKRPYTSLEKLFQPFTSDAWLCIALGYATFALLTLALLRTGRRMMPMREPLQHHPLYQLWVLLMGGAIGRLRLDSVRVFTIGFILNTLVIRTLYQAGMFQRLQSSASLASDLNTLEAINKANLLYNMFPASLQFYKDNPLVPARRIKLVQHDHTDWDDLFGELAHDRLGGVMVSPLDCIAYYVKRHGKDGVIYLGRDTGFMYNLGFHYPKSTALQRPFDAWILRMHSAGLVHHWVEGYRDNRYWTNAKDDPEPASLKWGQISGGFYLCSVLLAGATVVFFGEMTYGRLRCRLRKEEPAAQEKRISSK
uniref:Ionotropic glutamate receptor L-glutamate and glycine-binding domain-containing protein n=1 Tax=Anopheles epiroticus TaxID=199890 RepID=A0A182PKL1_9DIPT